MNRTGAQHACLVFVLDVVVGKDSPHDEADIRKRRHEMNEHHARQRVGQPQANERDLHAHGDRNRRKYHRRKEQQLDRPPAPKLVQAEGASGEETDRGGNQGDDAGNHGGIDQSFDEPGPGGQNRQPRSEKCSGMSSGKYQLLLKAHGRRAMNGSSSMVTMRTMATTLMPLRTATLAVRAEA